MNQSTEINLVAKALLQVQREIEPIVKDSENPHFRNRYVSLDSMTEYVRPILAKHGLTVIQGGGDLTNGGLQVTTTLLHESGQWISSSFEMPLEKATPQAAGSAITYGRRYGLGAFLALANEDDDDGNRASQPKKRQTKTEAFDSKAKAIADNPEPITRDTPLTFGNMKGKTVKELKDSYLQWGLEEGRHFGPRTLEWQAAMREELASRDGVPA